MGGILKGFSTSAQKRLGIVLKKKMTVCSENKMDVLNHLALFDLVCSLLALKVAILSVHFFVNKLHCPKYLNAKYLLTY